MTEVYRREPFNSRLAWLNSRNRTREVNDVRISGTEAAVCCGDSPWTDLSELYDIKMGLAKKKDISKNRNVRYGIDMEPMIREAAMVDLPYFDLNYRAYDILISNRYKWMTCTLDGELSINTVINPWSFPVGAKGVLECKTGSWTRESDLDVWKEGIPIYYYEQMVHCLVVTGWNFAICAARLKRDGFKEEDNGFPEIRNFYYLIDARESYVQEDMETVVDMERRFIEENLKKKIRPPRVLAMEDL